MTSTARLGQVRREEGPPGADALARVQPEGEAILRHLVDFIDAFMWQADTTTLEISFVTSSVRDLLGHPVGRWSGPVERWSANIHPNDRDRVLACMRATGSDGVDREVEFGAKHADGRNLVLRLVVRLVNPPSGPGELWGITKDVTGDARVAETLRVAQERSRALIAQATQLRRQALEDPLTKLPNRLLFDDRAGALHRATERTGKPFAVLLMDLDRFKQINDTHGHQAGDVVLREVALRLRICLRSQDTPARLGGDEFAALLPETDEAGARRVGERIVRAMRSPVEANGVAHGIGISVGVGIHPSHGGTVEELLVAADDAMYRAKAGGGGVALATAEPTATPRRARRRRRGRGGRLAIGMAAVLAILAGALSPSADHRRADASSASRLESVSSALVDVESDEVVDVVAGAERTLADISLAEVAGPDVASALQRLHRTLDGLKSGVPAEVADRVDRLLASVQEVELLAQVSASAAGETVGSRAPDVDPAWPAKSKGIDRTSVPSPSPGSGAQP